MNFTTIKRPASRLITHEPIGTMIPFNGSPRELGGNRRAMPNDRSAAAIRLGHVHLKVAALDRALPFYLEILGLRLTERVGRFAFLAAGREHHSVALEEIGSWAARPPRHGRGVAHVAFEVPNIEAFTAMRRALLRARIPIISRNNGISWAIRFKDPDANEIEIYLDRRYTATGTLKWGGRWRAPFHLRDEPITEELEIAS
jgi:catechol 2,3-dioxygenase